MMVQGRVLARPDGWTSSSSATVCDSRLTHRTYMKLRFNDICMSVALGFGPSSGRTLEVCESSERNRGWKTRSAPPVLVALAAYAAALGLLYGTVKLYEGTVIPGTLILIASAALIAFLAVHTFMVPKKGR
jgi:hypothetical protein